MKLKCCLTAAVFFALSGGVAVAEEGEAANAAAPAQAYGDWTLRCARLQGALPCDIYQSIRHDGAKSQLLAISIVFSPEANKYGAQFVVPLGIDLRKGVEIFVGDVRATGVKPVRCELQGCYVEAMLADDMLGALRSASSGRLTIYTGGAGDGASIEFSLTGFAEAEAALIDRTAALTAIDD